MAEQDLTVGSAVNLGGAAPAPKVTIGSTATIDTPSAAIVKDANRVFPTRDARGREIKIKRVGMLQKMRLYEIVGPQNVQNPAYFGNVMLAAHVVEIDGDPVPFPVSKRELEALVVRLDEEGLGAVAVCAAQNLVAEDNEDAKELLKNALGTLS